MSFIDDGKINGIDRINSTGDYTEDNTVPCCKFCNRAKWDYSKVVND